MADAAEQAKSWLDDFRQALEPALPPQAATPSFVPADRLPHLNRLTGALNELMRQRGIDHTFTPDALDRTLRAEFSRITSGEGALLRVGRARPGEVLIKLSVAELVEMLDPAKTASEIMNGVLPQGGRSVGATANSSFGVNAGHRLHTWFAALPEGAVKEALKHVELGVSYNAGTSRSVTGGASDLALGGGVEDNRGESVLFEAAAGWTVQARTSLKDGWSPEVSVAHGDHADATGLRVYVSHAYTEPPPPGEARLPEGERGRTPFPGHVALGMTGLIDLADRTARALGDKHFPPGSVARQHLYNTMIEDVYGRLGQAVDDPRGVPRIIHVDGRPYAQVRIKAVPRLKTARRVGAASREHWQERLRVGVSSATGSESSSRSRGVSVSAGLTALPTADPVPGAGEYAVGYGPGVRGSTGASASDGLSVNGVTYHPSVQRYTGNTQGVELEFDYEVTVRLIDDDTTLGPIKGEGKGLFRFPEKDAYLYGLPVDERAFTLGPDGEPVFRDDPDPNPPPGRKGELPWYYGKEPGRLRGAGPALVQGMEEEAARLRATVEDELRAKGILPPLVDGEPRYSDDPLERLSQMLNEAEIAHQLSAERLQTGYDQATQDGIPVDLVVRRSGHAPRNLVLRITLDQHADPAGGLVHDFEGMTDAEAVVNLDIGSDTNVWSHSRSENAGYGGSVGARHALPAETGGISPNAEVGGGRDGSRTVSHTTGLTINGVRLTESTGPVAIFSVRHTARVELLDGDGRTETLAEEEGSARLLISGDLLPEVDRPPASAPSPTPDEVMRHATVQHIDPGDLLQVARHLLPGLTRPDSPGFLHIAEFLGVRSLLGHPELFRTPYGTDLAVRPQGAAPKKGSVAVRGRPGPSLFLGTTDDVNGVINLTLASMGVSAARSSGGKVEGKAGVSAQHADGSGEGGKVGGGHSGSGSRSQGDLSIWGRERLGIETGKQYVFLAPVGFDVTGNLSGAEPVTRQADGTMLYTVPERHALRLYADGVMDLPLHQMADVVERFVDGTLTLDRSVAVPLVKRYLSELPHASAPVPLAAGHTPMVLINALKPLVDGGSALTRVDDFLMRATDLNRAVREVELPSFLSDSIGHTLIEDARLTREGDDVELLDAVRDAVAAAAPQVLGGPAIPDSLRKIFAGDRWFGPIDTIFGEHGLELRYHTPFDEFGAREEVVVRVRGAFTDDAPVLLEHTDQVGMIIQDYTYQEQSRSETRSAANAVNAGGDVSGGELGDNGSLATDRSRSATGSVSEQETRIQRVAMFTGMDRVRQGIEITVEVERTAQQARTGSLGVRSAPPEQAPPVVLSGHLVRLVPTGLTRPAGTQPAEPPRRFDPRQVPLPASFAVNSVKANLHEAIREALTDPKLLGDGIHVRETELRNALSETAVTTLFERMTDEAGHTLLLPVEGWRNRVVEVRINASQTNLQVLARGLADVEIGQVWRIQRTTGTSTGGGMAFPVGGGMGVDDGAAGLGGGVSFGEQSSVNVSDGGGLRREMSRFEKDDAVIVRVTSHHDLTLTPQALTPEGPKRRGDPVHGAATGEAVVIMAESDYEAMIEILESGGSLGPEWQLVPAAGTAAKARTAPADPARPWGSLLEARVLSRALGEDVRVEITHPGGATHTYRASPDGTLRAEYDDHGFAAAFATLSPELAELADSRGLDLLQVHQNPRTQQHFADRVRTELAAQGADVTAAENQGAVWPAARPGPGGRPDSGGRAVGSAGTSVNAPEVAGSAFVADGRAPHLPDVTIDEIKEAVERDLRVSDFGGAVLGWSWTGPAGAASATLVVETEAWGTLRFTVSPGEVTPGNVGETELGDRRLWVPPRTADDQIARVVLHEISHAGRALAARAARAEQGVLRRWVSAARPWVGRDDCERARFDEFRHLTRRWVDARAAHARQPGPGTLDEVRKWTHELRSLADALRAQGRQPPSLPWSAGPQAEPGFHTGSVGALPVTATGLGILADLAGVTSITPGNAGRPVAPLTEGTFTVASGAGSLTLHLAEEDLPPGQAEVRASGPGRLSVAVSPTDGSGVRLRLAELIAEAVAEQAGLPPGNALVPGPLADVPALRRGDAATLVRVRALLEDRANASILERPLVEDRLRAELRDAGLAPGAEGAAARQVAAVRAGLLTPAQLDAVHDFSGRPVHPSLTAAVAALGRAAALMGAATTAHGSFLVDVTPPGGAPIAVEVVAGPPGMAGPAELTVRGGTHVLAVNLTWPLPLVERATAVAVTDAVAAASGAPDPAAAGAARLRAELQELVRQVRTATAQQRPGRFEALVETAEAHGLGTRSPGRDAARAALPPELAAGLTELLDHSIRGESRNAFWERMRRLANGTGWWPPEEHRRPPGPPAGGEEPTAPAATAGVVSA
jgi:hypothetical protein